MKWGPEMRKYLFNKQMISAVLSGVSTLKIAKAGPRDWRLGLLAVIWGLGVAVTVGTIAIEAREAKDAAAREEEG